MLAPKRTKHRKTFRIKSGGVATARTTVSFGKYGLKALESSWVTARQIEAARRVMSRYFKRGGKIWIRIFPDMPVTAKSAEVPMGGGKGAVDHYVSVVKSGMILFEVDGITEANAHEALTLAGHKLPVTTR
ncbi:MAG: 50S ribosomal protein L16, partial [Patescibacteria group bacterium]